MPVSSVSFMLIFAFRTVFDLIEGPDTMTAHDLPQHGHQSPVFLPGAAVFMAVDIADRVKDNMYMRCLGVLMESADDLVGPS